MHAFWPQASTNMCWSIYWPLFQLGGAFFLSFWGDRQKNRPKPFTAFNAHPKSRSAPSTHGQLSSGPAEGVGRLVDVVSPLVVGTNLKLKV